MQRYLEPDSHPLTRIRERQRRMLDRLRDTLRGSTPNKMLQPIEENIKDVTKGTG